MVGSTSLGYLGSYIGSYFLKKKIQYGLEYFMVQLIPLIKSAYQISVKMNIKRRTACNL